jgi:hypothetical protein
MRLARLPVLASGEVLRKPLRCEVGDDFAGVAKLTAAFKRLNAGEETASFESRYLFLQLKTWMNQPSSIGVRHSARTAKRPRRSNPTSDQSICVETTKKPARSTVATATTDDNHTTFENVAMINDLVVLGVYHQGISFWPSVVATADGSSAPAGVS